MAAVHVRTRLLKFILCKFTYGYGRAKNRNFEIKMEEENWFCNLIEAVRAEKIVYDKKNPNFFNKVEKQKSWERIAEKVGKTSKLYLKYCNINEIVNTLNILSNYRTRM